MSYSSIKTLVQAGRGVAVLALLAGPAMAQTTVIATPQGNDVLVSERALDTDQPKGLEWADDYPVLEQVENNDAIIDMMIGQGFSDLKILRKGQMLTITGQRDGVPTELVYSTANGRLLSVDGVETRDATDSPSSIADRMMDNIPENAPGAGSAEDHVAPQEPDGDDIGMGTDAGIDLDNPAPTAPEGTPPTN